MPSASNCGRFSPQQGVDLAFVKDTAEIHTGTAIITIADADNTIVVVPGANALVSADDVAAPALAKGDIAVSQFEIPQATIAAFFKRARAAGATTILNPAPAIACEPELLDLVDILILNETELGLLTNTELHDSDDPARFIEAARSLQVGPDRIVCVTLGKRGVLALIGGEASIDCRPRGAGRRYHRRRRLLCRCAGGAACRRKNHSRRARLRQCRRIDLRAADGRRAVDADGSGGRGRPLIRRALPALPISLPLARACPNRPPGSGLSVHTCRRHQA